ncbi:hypothetical protein SEL4445_41770 [Salmonella enterica subsp. enterica serovar 4,[5],12:i:-]|uniref:Uncharacterized protein n=1 Tax=Salmonella enterica subsp. enterica serovar 4,[5],12:i:- TaxID=440524 RepID=A0A8D4ZVM6_SALET|nr:hypothetical protein SEL4445_41770 [Salmonella enterica subsp. enterica serovar 4,[5],12:i:-]BCI19484.1 hypothetical protein SEL4567_41770 [Salmonella enterica subsp. enterica serovar 4,[5],12:i:-]BCI29033.1 hypothetical protein SEL4596_41750 [Salmonella enterica subsp. enterica serovar 4,[5],12:i:-]BCI33872.1 hypothetical protein SEL4605_41690 [Salmonella enterica subsp. enterica serovar 4,[5],12:i:-]
MKSYIYKSLTTLCKCADCQQFYLCVGHDVLNACYAFFNSTQARVPVLSVRFCRKNCP